MTATAQQLEFIKESIKSIPDYPKPGILFPTSPACWKIRKPTPRPSRCSSSAIAIVALPKSSAPKRAVSCSVRRSRWD